MPGVARGGAAGTCGAAWGGGGSVRRVPSTTIMIPCMKPTSGCSRTGPAAMTVCRRMNLMPPSRTMLTRPRGVAVEIGRAPYGPKSYRALRYTYPVLLRFPRTPVPTCTAPETCNLLGSCHFTYPSERLPPILPEIFSCESCW